MKKYIFSLFLFISFTAQAHNVGSVYGLVYDAKSKMPLIGVNIQLKGH